MADDKLPVPAPKYEIGYARPPAEHRFAKGQSGNPGGRPKRPKQVKPNPDHRFGMKAAEDYLRLEAYRPITLREGDQLIELPAIQAVFRAMGVSALKGNRFVQKTLTEMVAKMEAEHHTAKIELFGASIDYKIAWTHEIERCRNAGLPEPKPVPHPDDMIIDLNLGDVRVEGPKTQEQRDRLDQAIERRKYAQDDVNHYALLHRRARDPAMKQRYLGEWHFEQRMFDIINDILPGRYKIELQNRSYEQGASQAGKALAELKKSRKLRSEYIGQSD